jgi:hypothetical protein
MYLSVVGIRGMRAEMLDFYSQLAVKELKKKKKIVNHVKRHFWLKSYP